MSHGPLPVKGFDAALPVARARGTVMFFRRMRGSTADLMVSGSGTLAIILLRFAPRLAGSPAGIAAEYRDAIAVLRLHPSGGPVSRELWLYSRYGVLRFFRVEDTRIVELRADGSVMPEGPAVPAATRRSRSCAKMPALEQPVPGKRPAGPAACGKTPVVPVQPVAGESLIVPAPGFEVITVKKEPVAEEGPGGPGA